MPFDVGALVSPFHGLSGVDLAIEGPAGATLAGTSTEPPPIDAVSLAIEVGPLAGSRISVWGPRAEPTLSRAFLAAVVVALEQDARTSDRMGHRDPATARRIEDELALGRRLQRSFVSLVAPEVPGYEVASHYEAAREVGGDFFDLFRLRRRGRPLSVVIADVTGKGIAAALMMAFSRPLLHAAIDQTTGPAAALMRTNRILVEERRSSLFITALCARLDLPSGHLEVANAGRIPPWVGTPDRGVRSPGDPGGRRRSRAGRPRAVLHGRCHRCALGHRRAFRGGAAVRRSGVGTRRHGTGCRRLGRPRYGRIPGTRRTGRRRHDRRDPPCADAATAIAESSRVNRPNRDGPAGTGPAGPTGGAWGAA